MAPLLSGKCSKTETLSDGEELIQKAAELIDERNRSLSKAEVDRMGTKARVVRVGGEMYAEEGQSDPEYRHPQAGFFKDYAIIAPSQRGEAGLRGAILGCGRMVIVQIMSRRGWRRTIRHERLIGLRRHDAARIQHRRKPGGDEKPDQSAYPASVAFVSEQARHGPGEGGWLVCRRI
jgi:hypothetical protein